MWYKKYDFFSKFRKIVEFTPDKNNPNLPLFGLGPSF
jgi:hypothetical protein